MPYNRKLILEENKKKDQHPVIVFLSSKVLLLVLSVLLIAVLSAFTRDFVQKRSVDSEVANLKKQIEDLKMKRDKNLAYLDYYESDDFLKQEAKRNLEMKEAGEQVVIIKDKELINVIPLFTDYKIDVNINKASNENKTTQSKIHKQFNIWYKYFFKK